MRRPRKKKGEKGKKTREVPLQLYDLETDIDEEYNIAAEHPEITKRLTDMALKFDRQLRANSRPAGRA